MESTGRKIYKTFYICFCAKSEFLNVQSIDNKQRRYFNTFHGMSTKRLIKGKRSELRKSERRKPKRTPKTP